MIESQTIVVCAPSIQATCRWLQAIVDYVSVWSTLLTFRERSLTTFTYSREFITNVLSLAGLFCPHLRASHVCMHTNSLEQSTLVWHSTWSAASGYTIGRECCLPNILITVATSLTGVLPLLVRPVGFMMNHLSLVFEHILRTYTQWCGSQPFRDRDRSTGTIKTKEYENGNSRLGRLVDRDRYELVTIRAFRVGAIILYHRKSPDAWDTVGQVTFFYPFILTLIISP